MEYLRGFKGPLTFQANGDLEQAIDVDALATDLFQILSDRKGEWMFNYNHGLTLLDRIMSPKDNILAVQIETVLRREVLEQEPRVRILGVEVNTEPSDDPDLTNVSTVTIRFVVGATGEEASINLQIARP